MRKTVMMLLLGFLLAAIASIASIGLLSLAGYLICAAAFAGLALTTALTFNYLLPAACIRAFALVRIAGRYGERVTTHDATFRLLAKLRVWFYLKLEPLAPAHFLKHNSGELLQRMTDDIDILNQIYLKIAAPFFIALIVMLVVYAVIYYFNSLIAGYVFMTMLTALIIISLLQLWLGYRPGVAITTLMTDLRQQTVTVVYHLSDILLCNAETQFTRSISQLNRRFIQAQQRMANLTGLSIALVSLLASMAVWIALMLGIPLVNQHQLSGAYLGLIILTILAGFEVILPIPIAFQLLGRSLFAAQRLRSIVQEKPSVSFANKSAVTLNHYDISLHQVCFRYDTSPQLVFNDFSVEIKSGEKIAIVGATGSGKSTLIHLLARSIDATNGRITIGKVDIKQFSEAQLRQSVCLITQYSHMFNASVKENLRFANPVATDQQIIDALTLVDMYDHVTNLPHGSNSIIGEFGSRFSGGQLKRLALARAVLANAPIILLDEPTESLDHGLVKTIWPRLIQYWHDRTVIVVTHQQQWLSHIQRIISV